jgi:hypothetical protein
VLRILFLSGFRLQTGGVNDLTILSAGAVGLSSLGSYPFTVRGMGSADLSLIFVPTGLGRVYGYGGYYE